MSIPISRFSKSPLKRFSVATLRRWYFSEEHEYFTAIHRYAILCELKSRDYPINDWPQFDPFYGLSTTHLREIEDSQDPIAAHAARDEINKRGEENWIKGIHRALDIPNCEGSRRYSFAAC